MLKKLFLLLFLIPSIVFAQGQDNCPALVLSTITTADEACASTGRNQACYGNISVQAEAQPDASNFVFEKAGDVVDVATVQRLQLSAMNVETDEWGIVILRVQANLPDTLPGQNVQMVLFGDVELRPAGEFEPAPPVEPEAEPVTLSVTISGGLNVRGGPSTNNAVIGSVSSGDVVTAIGRNEAGDWLQVLLSEDVEDLGWLYAPLVTVDGDLLSLPVVGSTNDTPVEAPEAPGPLQAFYFQTGISNAACREAPNGLMIQTPEGAGEIALVMNEVTFNLGSTAYLRLDEDELLATVLEGNARIETEQGTDDYVPAGAQLRITDAETIIEPFNEEEVNALPIGLLDREIQIRNALKNICEAENPISARQVDVSNTTLVGQNTPWYFLPAGTSLTLENTGGTRKGQGGYVMILDRRVMVPVGEGSFYNAARDNPYANSEDARTLTITTERNFVFYIDFALTAGDNVAITATCS